MPSRLVALVLAAAAVGCFRAPPPPKATTPTGPEVAPPPRVRLAVVVVFDQLRADYLERWRPLFGPDGFNRLTADGAWFTNCHYPYATTTTGPGHASILTGCSPDRHGIVNNEWYDRSEGLDVYCAGMPRYTPVPPDPNLSAKAKNRGAGTPDRLLSPTVADVLKTTTNGRGKVIGLSLKDRGAVLPCGKTPDGAYWFDDRFCTSTYYRDALPRWAADLNTTGFADRWFGKTWDRFRGDVNYERHSGPDAGPGEGTGSKQGTVFPHVIDGGLKKPGPAYYAAVESSPFGNDLLLAGLTAAVEAEGLGTDEVPDLLVVSFSSNDLVGHAWGPDSQEVLDVTLRSDGLMSDLLKYLDGKIGSGKYSVVLTADHGVCPLPEASAKKGQNARRVPVAPLVTGAEAHLTSKFGGSAEPAWLEAVSLPQLYLNHRKLKERGIDPVKAGIELAGWLRTQPEVYRAYPRAELMGAPASGEDKIAARVRKAYHADRSGDVYVVGRPYWLYGNETASGTTHGSPHDYDTHVPLLAFGPGVAGGRRTEAVTPQHAAPITAAFLGVPLPRDCEYKVPATLTR